ncbi:DNA gyrase subunit A [bacterium]|nr:DNA gyrase subunit A [bacterium]
MIAKKLFPVPIEEEMKNSYLDYAMSVIVSRALPDVRDGLKPVHRRILWSMYEENVLPDRPHKKSAWIVGQVMGRYHPHGDAAIYESLVRLAQDFETRYPLIDGHGNFGSIDGDSPAAMRYTEVRLAPIAMEMLSDIEKDTVEWLPNYDGSLKEPSVLPAKIPHLLLNGSAGIAVGMATSIPPHNLTEVIDALLLLIEKPRASLNEIMNVLKGPDFPTGGIIFASPQKLKEIYKKGKGQLPIQAVTHFEELSGGRSAIVVTEIPYQVNKAKLIEQIADLVKARKVEGIADLRDESDKEGLRVVIELKRDAQPKKVLNYLLKHTALRTTFGVNMLALVDGTPRLLGIIDILNNFIQHRKEVVLRRSQYDLNKAKARAHILEGLLKALDHIDRVIRIIRSSSSPAEAKKNLMDFLKITEEQAQAILDMRLSQLTRLERSQIEGELKSLREEIKRLEGIIKSPKKLLEVIKEELEEIKRKYGDGRRTRILHEEPKEITEEDIIPEEEMVVILTRDNYIKKVPLSSFQGGRKGLTLTTKEEDSISHLFVASSHSTLLFVTDRGQCYSLRAFEIPQTSRQAAGTALDNLLTLQEGERIRCAIPLPSKEGYLFLATVKGLVKRLELKEINGGKRGVQIMRLEENDRLCSALLTDGEQQILLTTKKGMGIRFSEKDVRPMGRSAGGVKGISLGKDDEVISAEAISPKSFIILASERGFLKKIGENDVRVQGRGGKGIILWRTNKKSGLVACVGVMENNDRFLLSSAKGNVYHFKVKDLKEGKRETQGVQMVELPQDDKIASLGKIVRGS